MNAQTGILSMPAVQYHAAAGVSKSMLDDIADPNTPLHFWAKHIGKTAAREETPAMKLGSETHRCILEPDTMDGAFYVRPEGMKFTTKDGIAWRDAHADRPIIAADDAEAIKGMRDAVWDHPMAKRLLTGGKMESNLFAEDKDGILRKGRLDALTAGNVIPDLKTITSADLRTVETSISDYRYYVQGAYYCDLCRLLSIEKQAFVLICVEKTAPFDVVCYQLADEVIEAGRLCYRRDLALLNSCRERNEWPGRSNHIETAGLPAWAMKQLEQIL